MEVKLFGKSLFEFKKGSSNAIFQNSTAQIEKSKFLPDFHTNQGNDWSLSEYLVVEELPNPNKKKVSKKKSGRPAKVITLTPKGVYEMKTLNSKGFVVNTDKKYVDEQVQQFKDKLSLIKASEYDMDRGVIEIASILFRFENRKKYAKHRKFYDEFPYTTTSKINKVLEVHKNLQLGKVAQFLADMPKDAVKVMKDYEKETKTLCDKKPIYYIIADKKDFQKSDKRRDPILLAQSPFGHFWQILGAWDKEMLFLEEL